MYQIFFYTSSFSLSFPVSQSWKGDLNKNCLFGKWFQETLVSSGEETQEGEHTQYSVHYQTTTTVGQMEKSQCRLLSSELFPLGG